MIDEKHWLELAQAEDEAYFKGDLVLSLPEGSYTAEEMWDIVMGMFKAAIAIQDAMRADFESLPGPDQIRLFDALCLSGVRSPEWWFNVLLAEQEELPEGILDRGSQNSHDEAGRPTEGRPASLSFALATPAPPRAAR